MIGTMTFHACLLKYTLHLLTVQILLANELYLSTGHFYTYLLVSCPHDGTTATHIRMQNKIYFTEIISSLTHHSGKYQLAIPIVAQHNTTVATQDDSTNLKC